MKYLAVVGKRYISEMEFPWSKKLGRLYILDNEEKATIHSYIQDSWLQKQLVEFTNCQLLKSQKKKKITNANHSLARNSASQPHSLPQILKSLSFLIITQNIYS